MRITADSYGSNLRSALEKKKLTSTTAKNYRITDVNADRIVTWVESHDNYCNDDIPENNQYSSWYKLNNEQIQQGWAVIAAQGDTTPLFFARPQGSAPRDPGASDTVNFNNKWGANTIGIAGDGNYFSDEVVEVNKFRNAMVGEGKNLVDVIRQKVTMIERGTKGAVLVSVSDSDTNVNVSTALADGEYTDRVNGGDFTVKDGMLTGKITAGEVVVLYQSEEPEVLVGDVDGNGSVTIDDVTVLQRHLAAFSNSDGTAIIDETNAAAFKAADVNGDGVISVGDVTALQRKLAKFT